MTNREKINDVAREFWRLASPRLGPAAATALADAGADSDALVIDADDGTVLGAVPRARVAPALAEGLADFGAAPLPEHVRLVVIFTREKRAIWCDLPRGEVTRGAVEASQQADLLDRYARAIALSGRPSRALVGAGGGGRLEAAWRRTTDGLTAISVMAVVDPRRTGGVLLGAAAAMAHQKAPGDGATALLGAAVKLFVAEDPALVATAREALAACEASLRTSPNPDALRVGVAALRLVLDPMAPAMRAATARAAALNALSASLGPCTPGDPRLVAAIGALADVCRGTVPALAADDVAAACAAAGAPS